MSGEQKQYHWVHKGPYSKQFSRSEGDEAASILRFVQQGRKPSRKQRVELGRRYQHGFIAFEFGSEQRSNAAVLPLNHKNADIRTLQSKWRLEVPRNNFTPASGLDPFQAAVVPLDRTMYQILQYMKFNLTIGAGGYKLEVFPQNLKPMMDMYEAATQYLFHNMSQLKFIIYPALGAFSRRLDRLSPEHVHHPWRSDHFMQLATQAVRESITDRSNQLSFIATGVHFLVCSAGLDDRFDESNMHIRAFMRFLPHIDTHSLVGYWELDSVSYWDILNAAATGRAPLIKVATGDPGPMSTVRLAAFRERLVQLKQEIMPLEADKDVKSIPYRSTVHNFDIMSNPCHDLELDMGSALEVACERRILSVNIVPIIYRILDCLLVAKVMWKALGFADKADAQWLCRRIRAVMHQLLSLRMSRLSEGNRLTECVRLTLIIVLMSAQSRLLHQSRQLQASRLRAALEASLSLYLDDKDRNMHTHGEMLFWILATGYWSAQDSSDEVWFAENALQVYNQVSGDANLQGMSCIMQKHIYAESVQSGSLTKLMEMARISEDE